MSTWLFKCLEMNVAVVEDLPCEQAELYLHSLFMCHVFLPWGHLFALMCNANASLIGIWHSITQSNTITQC